MTQATLLLSVLLALAALCAGPAAGAAQVAVRVSVRVQSHDGPVAGATIVLGPQTAATGDSGEAVVQVAPGRWPLRVERLGFAAYETTLEIARDTVVVIELAEEAIEEEPIVVVSTRGDRRVEDEPVRIEVIAQEEIEEKLLMTPGSIAMLLNETTGLRVQETSPSLGGAMIRIQGLRGRYTQLLSDGLPLYGGQAGALGLLQIPPMDLRQVEVIKGAASALYGASALGGVVNLVSRRPDGARELLLNRTTRDGTDVMLWLAGPPRDDGGSWTMLAGAHVQRSVDVDDDAWTDIPRYRRVSVRPRYFHTRGPDAVMLTGGFMFEDREGGGITPTGVTRAQDLGTVRADGGLMFRRLLGRVLFDARASAARIAHDHRFGLQRERDVHATLFAESSLRGAFGPHSWTVGLALQRDAYRGEDVTGFDYTYTVPAIFAQQELRVSDAIDLSLSARLDTHSEYGTFLSPRLAALLRPGGTWTLRLSAGGGTFAPTPFTEETEEIGLARVRVPAGLEAERARGASADLGSLFGPFELNVTVFGSVIDHAIAVRPDIASGLAQLVNVDGPTRTAGTEILLRYRAEPFAITASHTFVHATEPDPTGSGRVRVPNAPRHTAGLVAVYEVHGTGRAGLEVYYTGCQRLEDNPYATSSRAYTIVGLLFERRFGPVRAFLNLENLTDVRQTRWQPVVRPAAGDYGRWTIDTWAPLEGRVFNGGIRLNW